MADDPKRIASRAAQAARSGAHQKILVLVTADPKTAMVIRRAKRVGDFLGAECFAVAVQPLAAPSAMPEAEREAVERHLNFARNLHIETEFWKGTKWPPRWSILRAGISHPDLRGAAAPARLALPRRSVAGF
jgi:K+-sensing histidine kinase KdpD